MFPTLSFGDQEFSPEEMRVRSATAAGAMAAAGLREGDTIALMLRNEPALMDVMLAARQLGLYFTPLNWHFKSEEAAYIIRDCGAKALFAHSDLFQQIAEGVPADVPVFALRPHPLTITAYNIEEPATRIPHGTTDWAALVAAADPLATSATIPRGMVAYTSGTTGRPKGVRRFPPSPEEVQTFSEFMALMFQKGLGLFARCPLPDFSAALSQRAVRIFAHDGAVWRVAADRAQIRCAVDAVNDRTPADNPSVSRSYHVCPAAPVA
jgi:long-chain acyl-CoA synthetase